MLNTFIRAYSIAPNTNENAIHVGGITGFLLSLGAAVKLIKPAYIYIVFDGKGGSVRRRKLFPDYKSQRRTRKILRPDFYDTTEEDTKQQQYELLRLMDYLHELPVTLISIDNIEADDTIAYMTKTIFNDNKTHINIMSSDRDFLQLINDKCKVWSPTKKIWYDVNKVYEEYEINPENYLTYRALTGDDSDNIPGIRGVGLKTLQKRFPILFESDKKVTIEDIINISSEKSSTSNVYNSINENKEQLRLNEKLMQLNDVDISEFAKSKISVQINTNKNRLSKSNFIRMLSEDRMTLGKTDIIKWLNNFNYIDSLNK